MIWNVILSRKAEKQSALLPRPVLAALNELLQCIKATGPVRAIGRIIQSCRTGSTIAT